MTHRSTVSVDARRIAWLRLGIWLLGLTIALWQAVVYRNWINADTVSYLDMSDGVRTGDWGRLVNASWSPLYPTLIGVLSALVKPAPASEFGVAHAMNFLSFVFAFACFEVLMRAIDAVMRRRSQAGDDRVAAATLGAVHDRLFALSLRIARAVDLDEAHARHVDVGLSLPEPRESRLHRERSRRMANVHRAGRDARPRISRQDDHVPAGRDHAWRFAHSARSHCGPNRQGSRRWRDRARARLAAHRASLSTHEAPHRRRGRPDDAPDVDRSVRSLHRARRAGERQARSHADEHLRGPGCVFVRPPHGGHAAILVRSDVLDDGRQVGGAAAPSGARDLQQRDDLSANPEAAWSRDRCTRRAVLPGGACRDRECRACILAAFRCRHHGARRVCHGARRRAVRRRVLRARRARAVLRHSTSGRHLATRGLRGGRRRRGEPRVLHGTPNASRLQR